MWDGFTAAAIGDAKFTKAPAVRAQDRAVLEAALRGPGSAADGGGTGGSLIALGEDFKIRRTVCMLVISGLGEELIRDGWSTKNQNGPGKPRQRAP